MAQQRPLELILSRNLLASLSTPAFLVGEAGELVFYNEAAGILVGKRFEETGRMSAERWTSLFGPFDENGEAIPWNRIPATRELARNRAYHGNFRICGADGQRYEIAASAIPIVGPGGSSGAIVFFWSLEEDDCEGSDADAEVTVRADQVTASGERG